LPEALSQTECSDDSIRMKFVCEVWAPGLSLAFAWEEE
jgi:hypothetical protein